MDALSHLLQLARVQVRLDKRCLLGGVFALPHDAAPQAAFFHLVLRGRCQLQLDGCLLPLEEGDWLLLPQGNAHGMVHAATQGLPQARVRAPVLLQPGTALALHSNVGAQGSASVELLCGSYSYARGAGQLLSQWLPPLLRVNLFHRADPPGLQALLAWLCREAQGPAQPGAQAVLDGLGQALLALALRAAPQAELPSGLLPLLADVRLAPSLHALLADPGQPWTIATLAETVAMSRATYARRFQALAGCGVAECVLRVRTLQACVWLTDDQRSVADVATAVGYGSEAAFATAFKRVLGQTPARWRRLQGSTAP
ncbi:MAG: AraC family transcriptional regulator [Acidovorax sp.]|jgi:AraC family transcriptional activator of mtrCDE|nr:AraC family transcriptional regulator [Acidovorax sp.]